MSELDRCKHCGGEAEYYRSKEKLYYVWHSMRKRCELTTYFQYPAYGGRGIGLCDEWHDYDCFRNWALSNGYREGLSIDRIDVNGNYEPTNCRWTTMTEQNYNKRNNRRIEYSGETKVMAQWAKEYNITSKALSKRLDLGWDIERALKTPIRKCTKRVKCTTTGKEYPTIKTAAGDLSVSDSAISEICKGKRRTIHGYKFEYVD